MGKPAKLVLQAVDPEPAVEQVPVDSFNIAIAEMDSYSTWLHDRRASPEQMTDLAFKRQALIELRSIAFGLYKLHELLASK